jgi:hypothetical protein
MQRISFQAELCVTAEDARAALARLESLTSGVGLQLSIADELLPDLDPVLYVNEQAEPQVIVEWDEPPQVTPADSVVAYGD